MVKKIILFIFLLFIVTHNTQAQPVDPGDGGCNPDEGPCDDGSEEEVPLDDGVTYLLIAGVIYGVTRLSKNLRLQLAEDKL